MGLADRRVVASRVPPAWQKSLRHCRTIPVSGSVVKQLSNADRLGRAVGTGVCGGLAIGTSCAYFEARIHRR